MRPLIRTGATRRATRARNRSSGRVRPAGAANWRPCSAWINRRRRPPRCSTSAAGLRQGWLAELLKEARGWSASSAWTSLAPARLGDGRRAPAAPRQHGAPGSASGWGSCCTARWTYRDSRLRGFDGGRGWSRSSSTWTRRGSARSRRGLFRPRAARHRHRDHAERRVQRACSTGCRPGSFRHADHRFEWTRAQFIEWADGGRCPPRLPGRDLRHRARGHGTWKARGLESTGPGKHGAGRRKVSAVPRRSRCVPAMTVIKIPGSLAGGPGRRLRLRQVDVRRAALQGQPEVISSDFCRGLVSDDEKRPVGHRRRLSR